MARMGELIPVKNSRPEMGEALEYVALNVEDEGGRNERWLLFTKREVAALTEFTGGDWCDIKLGRLHPLHVKGRSPQWFVKIGDKGRVNRRMVRIGYPLLKRAEKRALLNPEDIPEKGLLRDLFD